jgi:hypothetical protein
MITGVRAALGPIEPAPQRLLNPAFTSNTLATGRTGPQLREIPHLTLKFWPRPRPTTVGKPAPVTGTEHNKPTPSRAWTPT